MKKDQYQIESEIRKEYFLKEMEHKKRHFCFARIKTLLTLILICCSGTLFYCWDEIIFCITTNFEAVVGLFAIIMGVGSLVLLFFPLDWFYKKKNVKEVEC